MGDSSTKELAVEVEADVADVAALVGSEKIAGTAHFEIAHGEAEAGAEPSIALDGVHAVAGGVDEVAALGEHEVGEGFVVGATDATAELVEIGEAEAFGVFYK